MNSEYFQNINHKLLELVPNDALNIIEVGCAEGQLGSVLKNLNSNRYIVGFEYVEYVANIAKTRLDEVYIGDIQTMSIPESIKKDSIDCIIFGDVLEHLPQAQSVLEKFKPYLKKDGVILSCIPNVQNQEVIKQLLTQNFQYHQSGLLDKTHTNLMTLPNIFKMFLDAQYKPHLHSINSSELDDNFYKSLTKTFKYLKIDLEYSKKTLSAFQYIVIAYPNHTTTLNSAEPTTIITKNDNFIDFCNNINISPDLISNENISFKLIRNNKSILKNIQSEIINTSDNWIILTQDNVYLPRNWISHVQKLWDKYEKINNCKVGVLGVAGLEKNTGKLISNCIIRDQSFFSNDNNQLEVNALLSSVLIFRKDRFTPNVTKYYNFNTIGSEISSQLAKLNLTAHIIDIPCFINTTNSPDKISNRYFNTPLYKCIFKTFNFIPKKYAQLIIHYIIKIKKRL